MTCAAFRTIPTGVFSSETIACAKPEAHKGAHRSAWIKASRINELTQTDAVRVEWTDKKVNL